MNIRLTSAQKGILCIISSAFFFTVMNLCAKLSGNLPSIQKAFFRNSIACCASIFVLIKNRQFVLPQKKNLLFLILRAVMGTAGLVSNFYAVSHLALADASILAKLAPFFTIFFSFLFLKERIRFTRLLATGAAGAGGQFNVTAAYSYAPAKNIAVFDYTQILFAAAFGFLLFHEIPDRYSIAGYVIICAIALMLFLKKE
jgi:integral membrane domain protein